MKKITAIVVACLMAASGCFSVYAKSLSTLQKEQKEVKEQTKEANSNLQETIIERSAAQAEIDALDAELNQVTDEVSFTEDQLEQVTIELAKTEDNLAEAENDRELQYEVLKERVKFMYINGNIGYLDVLFKSNDFADLLNRLDYINLIAAYDKDMLSNLEATEKTIADSLEKIERQKREIEVLKAQLEKKQATLVVTLEAKNEAVTALLMDEEKYSQQIADLNAADKEFEKLIKQKQAEEAKKAAEAAAARARAQAAAQVNYSGGAVGWPVQGNISSYYGYRKSPINGRNEFHKGIDIPAPTGTPIAASESGVVIFSGYQNGYGYTVIVDHGNGMSTLYAHASKLVSGVGETVTRGQTIAKVGSTGNSTGPHVHFEVRIGGVHKNPLNYLR